MFLFFSVPWWADDLRSYLKEVASAAPTLPFYYYHIPAFTGSNRESLHLIFSLFIGQVPLNVHSGSLYIIYLKTWVFPFYSTRVRRMQRPGDAHSNFQWCKVHWNNSNGLWPVCQIQSSQSLAPLWRWWGQSLPPFYLLYRVCHLKICIHCTDDVSDFDPLPACDLLLATAGRSRLRSQRCSRQVCVRLPVAAS